MFSWNFNNMKIKNLYSPNFERKKRTSNSIKTLIIHYTGMQSERESITKLCNPKSNALLSLNEYEAPIKLENNVISPLDLILKQRGRFQKQNVEMITFSSEDKPFVKTNKGSFGFNAKK